MPLLRFIDPDGKEQDVADINHLYELIQASRIGYDSLIRDDIAGRWMPARDHELFVRIRNIASQTALSLITTPSVNRGPWGEGPLSSEQATRYSIKKIEPTQKDVNKTTREPILAKGPGYRFMIVSGCIYIIAVIVCLAADKTGHGPLVALLATPILLPIMLAFLIPTMFLVWTLSGSPFIPISGMKEAMTRNGKFIIGGILLTSVLFAAVVASGVVSG
jgi:hypothetical protein